LPPGMLPASRGRVAASPQPRRSKYRATRDRKLHPIGGSAQALDAERLCKGPAATRQCPRSRGPAVKPRTPGVYFRLSRASYHAGPSVGTSDLKHILQATVEWWHSHMNDRRRTPQPCKSDGPCTSWCWRLCWRGLKEMDRASATTSALSVILILVLPRS
jgi:hypothetical protein